jgi:hypothetical protein
MRKNFVLVSTITVLVILVWSYFWNWALLLFLLVAPLIILGVADMIQTKQSIRRNFPLLGRLRYVLEDLRPKIQQYFIEGDTDGTPINRNDRSVIYQRAKKQIDTTPFGTQLKCLCGGIRMDESFYRAPRLHCCRPSSAHIGGKQRLQATL